MTRRIYTLGRLVCTTCAVVVCCAASTLSVHAQSVVVGPGFAEGLSAHQVELATAALGSALGMQGLTVVQPSGTRDAVLDDLGDILAPAKSSAIACDQACGAGLIASAAAELSAWVNLRRADAAHGGVDTSTVTLQDAAGHRYEGFAELRDGDVRDATTRAMLEARSYQLLGPGPYLNLVGTPEGAEVLIDGERAGALPYRAAIAAGKHELVVREPGYIKHSQTIAIPEDESRRVEVKVALEPTPVATQSSAVSLGAEQSSPTRSSRDSSWLAAPVAMGMIGLGLATVLSVRIATGLQCSEPCLEDRTLRAGPTVGGYALSVALVGASVTWIVLGMRSDASAGQESQLAAGIGLGQVQLTGSF
jgi:PEGA domain